MNPTTLEPGWLSSLPGLHAPYANWAFAVIAALASYLAMSMVLRIASARAAAFAAHTRNRFDDMAVEVFGATNRWLIALTALLIGASLLDLPARWATRIDHLWFITIALQFALWINELVTIALRVYVHRHATAGMTQVSASAMLLSWGLRTAIWTVVLLAVLSNLGVDITAFVASLGIGGIAIALAVQNVLGDLFASLAIAVDKPFEVGDAVQFGSVNGSVEHIGLKTTRVRSLSGEQIVISNTELLKQTIRNYKRMNERRIQFKFGVTYDTPADKAREIPGIVKRIVESSEQLRFDRAHLATLGESSLDYEVVYYVRDASYALYMDLQQMINLRLIEELQKLGTSLAFPTRTVQIVTVPAAGSDEGPAPEARSRQVMQ
ncbi:mechanosensitive ion channel family protein [Piscinibacter koreensis]|uniref:Mechanosensitive ion channel family protein n=1 Tax=Piscinibacter koreensis TaxID=2742824 RepID=A0A7Y6NKH1_9BURK|nr:mechanosensitive ion channel family protein [Schlegelella koreensis]NUZ04800.1 mechanosensitive ion channel family protein [Schlegelella koreensis]